MITEDQSEVVAFLSSPSTHGGSPVERIDTHAAVVFLTGTRAYKLKRAVRYDYLDFSTAERRKAMCEAELRINRSAAPSLYLGVVAVAREADGSLALGGAGTPVDWLVAMARFDQEGLFDRLAARGALDLAFMPPLASAIARFHQRAERRFDRGGAAGMAWVIDGNEAGFREHGSGILADADCAALTRDARAALGQHGALLDARRDDGFVKQCHGDLHLRNLVLLENRPTLFDAVEFNDDIACIDVLYDTAFLLMDLWRRGLPQHANVVWNTYLAETEDFHGVPLMPLFLSCRAAVRAKTSATAAALQTSAVRRHELQETARDYLTMARRLLRPAPAALIAIGGFSGSGKSTLAAALGPQVGAPPGALVLRSDEIRKRLCGVAPTQRLGPEGYVPEVSQHVYTTLFERAGVVVRGGQTAIVDAVFASAADRQAIENAASAARVPFLGLWLEAPEPVLVSRAGQRRLDASDAGPDVIRRQRARDTGAISWHRIDASGTADGVLQTVIAVLGDLGRRS